MSYQSVDANTNTLVPNDFITDKRNATPKTKLIFASITALILCVFCYARYIDPAVIDYAMNPSEFISNRKKNTVCQGTRLVICYIFHKI